MWYFLLVLALTQSASTLGYTITQITEPVDHGEGPAWDERTGILYFVDMFNGKLNAYDSNNGDVSSVTLDGALTLVVPSESSENRFIVGLDQIVAEIVWNREDDIECFEVVTVVDTDKPRNRLNDGKADIEGRLWFGTMGYESEGELFDLNAGSLYFITSENLENPDIAVNPVNISNGMTWNQANDKFYFVDTTSDQVTEFDYDNDSGTLSNARVIFNTADFSDTITGHPDGMTIDIDDKLWIAFYGGGAVIQFDPERREILQKIDIPATYTTSACWGGDNYDLLYVTTSRLLLNEDEREEEPQAGSVFIVSDLGTSGLPSYRSKITKT